MGFITSSANPPLDKTGKACPWWRPAARAAIDGALAVAAAGVALHAALDGSRRERALSSLAWAWAACTASAFGLAYGQHGSARRFWTAFGAGALLRVGVLVALMAVAWRESSSDAAARLGAYVLAVAGLTLFEFRHLIARNAR